MTLKLWLFSKWPWKFFKLLIILKVFENQRKPILRRSYLANSNIFQRKHRRSLNFDQPYNWSRILGSWNRGYGVETRGVARIFWRDDSKSLSRALQPLERWDIPMKKYQEMNPLFKNCKIVSVEKSHFSKKILKN